MTAAPETAALETGTGAPAPVAELEDLRVSFHTPRGVVQAVRSVTLSVMPGEVVALVGESGSGKSVLGMSLLGINGFVIGPLVYHLFPKFGLLTQPDQHFAMNLQPDLRVAFVKA